MSSSAPKEAINEPSLFNKVLEVIILVRNVCGNGPFPFPIVALIAFGCSYLIRFALLSGLILIILYFSILGVYRIFVFNRYLDPLLAIPGPKVSLA